jgi:hypothetical protein
VNAPELKELRESLGLPLTWIAEVTDVNVETAFAWETGKRPVPKKVLHILKTIEARFEAVIRIAVEQYETTRSAMVAYLRYSNDADLWKYMPEFKPLPVSCHAALADRVTRALTDAGAKAYAVYMLADQYEAWRSENKLPDTGETRSIWAAVQMSDLSGAGDSLSDRKADPGHNRR